VKALPWIALIVLAVVAALMSGCKPAESLVGITPAENRAGQYKSDTDQIFFETLDLAEGGAAMHQITFREGEDPEVVILLRGLVQIEQAQWSVDGNAIRVEGQTKESAAKGQSHTNIFQIQENGDLVRDNGAGEFVRFTKQ
jgi:hypothetical protein